MENRIILCFYMRLALVKEKKKNALGIDQRFAIHCIYTDKTWVIFRESCLVEAIQTIGSTGFSIHSLYTLVSYDCLINISSVL